MILTGIRLSLIQIWQDKENDMRHLSKPDTIRASIIPKLPHPPRNNMQIPGKMSAVYLKRLFIENVIAMEPRRETKLANDRTVPCSETLTRFVKHDRRPDKVNGYPIENVEKLNSIVCVVESAMAM